MGLDAIQDADIPLLVQEARKGHSIAFASLITRFSGRLFHFLLSMGLARQDAEDLLQDTLLKAYQNLDRYDGQYSFSTWLFTIGRRNAINYIRDRKKTKSMAGIDVAAKPAQTAYESDEIDSVWQSAAEILNEQQYGVLWLRYGEELPIRQIAEQMGLSEQNTRVILHRARAQLAEQMKTDDGGKKYADV